MIEHVYKRAGFSKLIDHVYVTTPDTEIADVVKSFGGACINTTDDVRGACDRVAQAASGLGYDVIVNLQGDEPLVRPAMLDRAVQTMIDAESIVRAADRRWHPPRALAGKT